MCARLMSRSAAVAMAAVVVCLGVFASEASGASVSLCVPATAGQTVKSGACAAGAGTTVALPASSADQQALLSVLPHMSFVPSGVDGKPTIRFHGVNVQLINDAGATASVNGTGNLVLGYDENPAALKQSGSHDLILGRNQSFTGYADLVAGFQNVATGNYATVSGGENNAAKSTAASVSGGDFNVAAGGVSSVTGGCSNLAGAGTVSVNSACTNTANSPHGFATVTGGVGNQAQGQGSSLSGGLGNLAGDAFSSIAGGCGNATGPGPTPTGNTCAGGLEAVLGGQNNLASGFEASVAGGGLNVASGQEAAVAGGDNNQAQANFSAVLGGHAEDINADFFSRAGSTNFAP